MKDEWLRGLQPTCVNFAVSIWNRFEHLRSLVDNLLHVWRSDSQVALHVCAFQGDDASPEEIQHAIGRLPCLTSLTLRTDKFGNGLGHNLAAARVPRDEIVCHIAVDICMPNDIIRRIRENVIEGEAYYLPKMYQQCKNGELATRGPGGALLALYKSDWFRVGGMWPLRAPWCGEPGTGGAEDARMETALDELGMEKRRPDETDLFCRWHERSLSNPFYRTLRHKRVPGKVHSVPWVDLVE